MTFIILKVISIFVPLRMDEATLRVGDDAVHGETAYAIGVEGRIEASLRRLGRAACREAGSASRRRMTAARSVQPATPQRWAVRGRSGMSCVRVPFGPAPVLRGGVSGLSALAPRSAMAAAPPAPAAAPAPKIDSGDTAWMLTSTALVLMMTIPGLALFYGGMVRKKNVLATVMQSFAVTCLVTVLWTIVGYSIAFTDGQRRLSAA